MCFLSHTQKSPSSPPFIYTYSTVEKFEWLVIILTMDNIAKKFTQGEYAHLIDFSNNNF